MHRGILGNLPKTVWVIDYPLFERIYYALVAGFDIYGNAGHQLAIRLYMDGLRVEGESYFLDFLPPDRRQEIMQSWYLNVDLKNIHYYPSAAPGEDPLWNGRPQARVRRAHRGRARPPGCTDNIRPHQLRPGRSRLSPLPDKYETPDDYLRAFRSLSRPGTPFVSLVNDHNANLAYLRIRRNNGTDVAGTLVLNRWRQNVAFLIGEDNRLDSSKDSIDFIRGLIGSYPNYFFDVHENDLPDFLDLLAHFDRSPKDLERLARYGVNRADEKLWETYDWFQKRFNEDEPVKGGLFDLNRYYYNAR